MLESTKQMLPELASRLRTQEYLSNAKKITLESDIVKKHPGLVEKLGFTIDNLTSEDVGRAHISVEDTLKQHPDKKET